MEQEAATTAPNHHLKYHTMAMSATTTGLLTSESYILLINFQWRRPHHNFHDFNTTGQPWRNLKSSFEVYFSLACFLPDEEVLFSFFFFRC